MMTRRPAYLTADCEAAKTHMPQVDGGVNTLSKQKRGACGDSGLSWRMPSMAMSILDNDYNNDNNDDDDDNDDNGNDNSGGGIGDRTTKKSGGLG